MFRVEHVETRNTSIRNAWKYLFLLLLIPRPKSRCQIDLTQVLLRSCRILQLQHDVLRTTKVQLRQIQLSGAHEVILQAPIVIEDLHEQQKIVVSEKESKRLIRFIKLSIWNTWIMED